MGSLITEFSCGWIRDDTGKNKNKKKRKKESSVWTQVKDK